MHNLTFEDLGFLMLTVFLFVWIVAIVHDIYVNVRLLQFIKEARARLADRELLTFAEHKLRPRSTQALDRDEVNA